MGQKTSSQNIPQYHNSQMHHIKQNLGQSYAQPSSNPLSISSNSTNPYSTSQVFRTPQLYSSQALSSAYPPYSQLITNHPQLSSQTNIRQSTITNLQSSIVGQSPPSTIKFIPELGPLGSIMKKPSEALKSKHVSFESGLQELLIIRENLRSSKGYFVKVTPHLQQQLAEIQNSIESQLISGIPDRTKMFYHLMQEKNYKLISSKVLEYKLYVTQCIDVLRKKNNVTKQEFSSIINIANNSLGFVKRLGKQLPVNGWKAVIASNNSAVYNSISAHGQRDQQVVQLFQVLEKNIGNGNFHYVRPIQESIYQSRTVSLLEDSNREDSYKMRVRTPVNN